MLVMNYYKKTLCPYLPKAKIGEILLVARLFDKETRKILNIRDRGQEKLDPEIIKYVCTEEKQQG